MNNKISIIYLKGDYFGGGHEARTKIIERFMKRKKYKLNLIPISNFAQLSENILILNKKNNILILDISHQKIVSKFNKKFVKESFNEIQPIIIDDVNRKSNISKFFEKNKCKILIPYVCDEKNLSLKKENIIGIGESFFIFDDKLYDYFLLSKKESSVPKKILLTFGQSDPQKITLKILEAIKSLKLKDNEYNFLFSIGKLFDNDYKEKLKSFTEEKNIKCIGSNIYKYFNQIDFAISASGLTKYEMVLFGIPQLLIHTDIDQKKASLAFEKKSGLKSYIKEEINDKIIKEFIIKYQENKPNEDFVKSIRNSYKKSNGLNQINVSIKNILKRIT
tara:strand:+ start:1541 stop:2542 length:1002 start_codon:yes stop_codon:yes gene_type:complete